MLQFGTICTWMKEDSFIWCHSTKYWGTYKFIEDHYFHVKLWVKRKTRSNSIVCVILSLISSFKFRLITDVTKWIYYVPSDHRIWALIFQCIWFLLSKSIATESTKYLIFMSFPLIVFVWENVSLNTKS